MFVYILRDRGKESVQDKVYKIKYLPRFEKDLEEITDYITFELYSTDSAINLINRNGSKKSTI